MKTNVYLTVCIIALSLPHSFGGIPGRPKWASPLVTSGAVNGSGATCGDRQTVYIPSECADLYPIHSAAYQVGLNGPHLWSPAELLTARRLLALMVKRSTSPLKTEISTRLIRLPDKTNQIGRSN